VRKGIFGGQAVNLAGIVIGAERQIGIDQIAALDRGKAGR